MKTVGCASADLVHGRIVVRAAVGVTGRDRQTVRVKGDAVERVAGKQKLTIPPAKGDSGGEVDGVTAAFLARNPGLKL